MPTSAVPSKALRTASSTTVVSPVRLVAGSAGTVVTGGWVKLSAPCYVPSRRSAGEPVW
jgi:hypothetical protein